MVSRKKSLIDRGAAANEGGGGGERGTSQTLFPKMPTVHTSSAAAIHGTVFLILSFMFLTVEVKQQKRGHRSKSRPFRHVRFEE